LCPLPLVLSLGTPEKSFVLVGSTAGDEGVGRELSFHRTQCLVVSVFCQAFAAASGAVEREMG